MKYLYIFFFFTYTYSYQVDLPARTADIKTENITSGWNNFYIDLAKMINDYLWFFLWVVAFIAVLYAGFLLISSNGSPEDLKKWNKILIWWLIGIFVSVLAYNIVQLVINLF
jgi:hypothetical protein